MPGSDTLPPAFNRFWLVAFIFWPIMFIGADLGHWTIGIAVGLISLLVAEAMTWRFTFGSWPNLRMTG